MASPVAASPMPSSPSGFSSPNKSSPTNSSRSSPRPSGPSKAPKPSRETCAMIISWLRNAVPAILQTSGFRTRRSQSEDPISTLAVFLNDGVVLADLVSFLDPTRLPPSSVLRATSRNAMSLPTSSSAAPYPSNIDSRQLFVQYKNNTRRVIAALKKVLDDVRTYSGFPHRPSPGAVDSFLGNVSAVPPLQDLRPTVRLAELVIAIAVYGPRHNEFRHSIWRFPSEATGSAFHMAMSAVSQAVALPPPDVLYAAGPPPPRPVQHVPGVMSPVGQPIPHLLSPQGRVHSPRPPLSPHPPQIPIVLSPRVSATNPILHPKAGSGSTQASKQTQYQGAKPVGTSPQQQGSPRHNALSQASSSPDHSLRNRSNRSSPRTSTSPQNPASPRIQSPRSGSGASTDQHSPAMQGRTPRTSSVSTRHSSSPRSSLRVSRRETTPQSSMVAPLSHSNIPDAKATPMTNESIQARLNVFEEGMDGRKLSVITDDSTSPLDSDNRIDTADSSGDFRALASVAKQVVESEYIQPSYSVDNVRIRRAGEPQDPDDNSQRHKGIPDEREHDSHRSSEEFFTPNELSPTGTPSAPSSSKKQFVKPSPSDSSPRPPSGQDELVSPAMSQIYIDPGTKRIYKETKVDENVRQSVTSAIAEQISRGTGGRQETAGRDARNVAPQLFRSESTTSSFDIRDQSYLLSPSTSDVPSPSNKWHIALERGSSQEILSPLPMFSPPAMPPSHLRSTVSTQTTPPIGSTPNPSLFRTVTNSPQLSISSTGGQSLAESSDTVPPPIQPKRASDLVGRGCTQAQANRNSTSSMGGLPPRPPKKLSSASASSMCSQRRPSPPTTTQAQGIISGKSRVSFAPTVISPGGHTRPLEGPLKSTENTPSRDQTLSPTRSSGMFSLPPSTDYDENKNSQSLPFEHTRAPFDSKEPDVEEKRNSNVSYSQQSYHTARSTFAEDLGEDIPEHENTVPGNEFDNYGGEVGDESQPFQRVQEYVVYNSDEEKRRLSEGQTELREAADDSDEVEDPVIQQDPHDVGVYDEDEEYEESAGNDDVSPRDDEDFEPNAEEFPESQLGSESMARTNIESMPIGRTRTEHQTDALELRSSAHIPGPEDFITPPVAVRMSHRSRRFKDVPETPPSPPNLQSLMQSISKSNLGDAERTEEEEDFDDDAPVSTMEPSAGLFQKLIAVWQSADELGTRPEDLMTGPKASPSTARFGHEGVISHLSGIESSNPSAVTGQEQGPEKRTSSGVKSERRGRPQAMRLPPAVAPTVVYSSELSVPDKRDDHEEGTSLASFSDAFSSDDKDRVWSETERLNDGVEWEEAMKGDNHAGLPLSPNEGMPTNISGSEGVKSPEEGTGTETETGPSDQGPRRIKSPTADFEDDSGVATDGRHVKVDRRRLDWLTKELLAARDAISRKELQMTFAETQRMEQEEILLLERQDAESVVGAMKKILAEREDELHDARTRLSVAIQSTPAAGDDVPSTVETGKDQRVSVESRSSNVGGGNLEKLIVEGNAKLHQRFDECNAKQVESNQNFSKEMRGLWNEVQRAMIEKMTEMTEKRDAELEALRRELANRERSIYELKQSSSDLVDQNRAIQAEASELRLEKEKTSHRYELEMSHVTAQVELVNEFSKKLHDNFRETENLRQQVLQYQDKLSHIASTSGVSQRQIKELREAVTRANDECARLRHEADLAKKKGMEAVRRAEELEELRYKDAAAHSAGRFPDRQDSGSYRSHEPVRPAGHNRPGGSGMNARYHTATRRGLRDGPGPAQKTWILIKEKIGGLVTGKDGGGSRRRGGRGNVMQGMSTSQTSRSQTRSRISQDDDVMMGRTRSGSRTSNGSESLGGGSMHSGGSHSNRSGGGGSMGGSGIIGGASVGGHSVGSASMDEEERRMMSGGHMIEGHESADVEDYVRR